MSNRRPPKAAAPPPADIDEPPAKQPESSRPSDSASVAYDAAALGYADLAELAPGAELPAFQQLRARLFADIDSAGDGFDFTQPQSESSAETAPLFVPAQSSIANGARTAAEIAADDRAQTAESDFDPHPAGDEVEWPVTESDALRSVILEKFVVHPDETDLDVMPDSDDEVAPHAVVESPPTEDATPDLEPALVVTVPASPAGLMRSSTVDEDPPQRRARLYVLLAAFVVVCLIGGWMLLTSDNDQSAAPSGPDFASRSVQAKSVSVATIDAESVTATQQLEFDSTVATLRLLVPKRGDNSAIADFEPTVDTIEIAVAGEPVQRVSDELSAGDTVTIELAHPSESISVSYVANGAVVRTEPSSAHRAKAWMTPLRVSVGDGSARSLTVRGDNILNLGCAERAATLACGEQTDDGWTVTPGATTNVIAQVDLPE